MAALEEWDTDPELMRLREEFTASLMERRECLGALLNALPPGLAAKVDLSELHMLVHRLAGVAGSYGFRTLGKICELLEEFLDSLAAGQSDTLKIRRLFSLLEDALELTVVAGDPAHLLGDGRFGELTSAA